MNVKEAQIVQEKLGEVRILVVRRDRYTTRDESEIRRDVRTWLSPTLEVRIEYVSEIARESNGKFRAVLSRLKTNERSQVTQGVSH